jgi:hypothetical protein
VAAASSARDDAVSEVVGYLIIFAIVMLSISLIYVNALPALQRSEEQNYLANVDQSFKVLASNINRILTGGAPAQSMEVRLRDSTVALLQKSTLNVSWTNNSGGNDSTGVETLATVEHAFQDRKIAYEGGGVWTKSPDGGVAVLISPPLIVGNTTVVPYATLTTGNTSLSGRGLIHVELQVPCRVLGQCAPSTVEYVNASRVTLNVTSEYCTGWKNFFERSLGFAAAHFDDADCADNRIIANVSEKLEKTNTTLYLTEVAMQGSLR